MKLNFEEYKSKVYACWTGKNIGGTIGGPYEGKREILNVTGFTTKPGEALPNDDLDLQLVWRRVLAVVYKRILERIRYCARKYVKRHYSASLRRFR